MNFRGQPGQRRLIFGVGVDLAGLFLGLDMVGVGTVGPDGPPFNFFKNLSVSTP